ncbi:PAS domain-containing sensor histidine kinase [Phenylobacterium deserti]|uniref:histidine kinase n=1 Tax=Phenylobacterium deserti TaxID=1914756 RepID=A0A328ANF6_9CAUL|nr:PAS domain-containing protein [Phenylobacterium deserti]RAK56460.1 hypothetical protein DJ018_00280 [Phenylobacterium deserti]
MSAADAFLDVLTAGGETGAMIRDRDWSATPLGPISTWPQSLRTALGLLLRSPVPIVMLWGEQGVMLYNDAYSVFAGGRHPTLLGSNVREGWPEVADFNDNVMRVGLAGDTLAYRDQELTLYRHGYAEQVWMNLDYSPVYDEAGRPAGVIAIVVETTAQVRAVQELKAERDRSRGVLERMGDAFMLVDRDFRVIEMNAEAVRIDGRGRDAIVGRTLWEAWPHLEPQTEANYRKVMAERTPLEFDDHYVFENRGEGWFAMRVFPVSEGVALFYREVTEERRAAQRLQLSEESLRLTTEAAEIGIWDLDVQKDLLSWSDRTRAMFGISPGVPVSMLDFYDLIHPDDLAATHAAFGAALDPARRATYDVEYRTIGKEDGRVRWVAAKGRGLFDAEGRCVRALGTAIDVTARKAAEERMHLLMREVDHRANNLLAVVQGTVSLSQAGDAQRLKEVIAGRVQALARAHQLLSDTRWAGASLRRLVEEEIMAFRLGDDGRVSLFGDDVSLAPAAAQSIAMALHELTTNAAKYGALSAPDGRVEIAWRVEGSQLRLQWSERGGPPVITPTRKGLGSTILARAVAGAVGGETRLDWRSEGLVCEIELPLEAA